MKKLLLVFEGVQFSEGVFECVRNLNRLEPVLVTGLFFSNVAYPRLWSYTTGMAGPAVLPAEEEQQDAIEKNINRFEALCRSNDITYRTHKHPHFSFTLLQKETRFSDLMILGSEKFFQDLVGVNSGDYLNEVLHNAECPVLIVPESFSLPERNILAYDGSESSVYAMKQFAYLFPGWTSNETLLVYSEDNHKKKLPEEDYVEELAARHYKDLNIMKLDINPRKYFAGWVSENKRAILVSGSYGRSSLSLMVKKSFVTEVIAQHKIPVFISHR